MPLNGGICEYDPEHTPFPQDLSNPDLALWFPSWVHNYQRRKVWMEHFEVFGPMFSRVRQRSISGTFPTTRSSIVLEGLPRSRRYVKEEREICPMCCMPLIGSECPLDASHQTKSLSHNGDFAESVGSPVRGARSEPFDVPQVSDTRTPLEDMQASAFARFAELPTDIETWLREMDEMGFLAQYHAAIAGSFDSVAQIVDVYSRQEDGQMKVSVTRFLDELGVRKLGHRRTFQRWFESWARRCETSHDPRGDHLFDVVD